jgi:hypothetical protein
MSGVAHRTLLLVQSAVLDLGIGQVFVHLLVALETQVLAISQEHVGKIGGVRIVALVAAFSRRLVFVLEFKLCLPVQVAEKTQV